MGARLLRLVVSSLVAFAAFAFAGAQSAVQYIQPPTGGTGLTASAMNNLGQVVGYYVVSTGGLKGGQKQVPFMWDGTFHKLPDLGNGGYATGINDNGFIIGNSIDTNGVLQAVEFTLTSATPVSDLVAGVGINNNNDFVVSGATDCVILNLITQVKLPVASQFVADHPQVGNSVINQYDQVSARAGSGNALFVDLGTGTGIDLGALLPATYNLYQPFAIAPNGDVSGIAYYVVKGGMGLTYFLWDPVNGMTLSPTDYAVAFNSLGDSVGYSDFGDGTSVPTYWHGGSVAAINDLLAPLSTTCSQVFLLNDHGQMVLDSGNKSTGGLAFFDPSLVQVTNADPTITVSGGGTFAYDGQPHAATATVTDTSGASLTPDPTITYDPGGTDAPVLPGTYQVTASFPGATGYNSGSSSATITILPPVAKVTLSAGTFTYDGTEHAATATVTDATTGDPIPGATATITYGPDGSTPPSSAGTYPVTATFAGDSLYESADDSGTLVIEKANLVASADNQTMVLNGSMPSLTGSLSGGVSSDGLGITFSTTATGGSPIGTYQIVPAVSDPLGKLTNYNLSIVNGTLSVVFNGNSGALNPINSDGSSVFKQGATVPIKLMVYDANGVSVGDPGTITGFYLVQIVAGTVSTTVNEDVPTNNPDAAFRWDGSEWIFNISTKSMTANQTYYFQVQLGDGSAIHFHFGLK